MQRSPSLIHSSVVPNSPVVTGSWSASSWSKQRKVLTARPRPERVRPYSVFSPIHYEANYAYPLVIWLHGPQSCELELRQVMPLVSVRNYVGIAPRGPRKSSNSERRYDWAYSSDNVAEACQRVRECIDVARDQYHIHPRRIFLAGYEAGGTMALRVGMELAELFAGAASFGGPVPRGCHAFQRINTARELPLLLSVSPDEHQYSDNQVMSDLRLLHSGGFRLNLRLYPGHDDLTDCMLSDFDHWMMGLICPVASTASSELF